MLLDETIVPAFTLRDRVPAAHVALVGGPLLVLAPHVRVGLERAMLAVAAEHFMRSGRNSEPMLRSACLSIWRPQLLNTYSQPTQAPTMPAPNAASTEARTRRSVVAEHRARFAARHEALRLHGAEVTAQMLGGSWNVLLVSKPGDLERIHIYTQVPSTSAALMNKLWEAGLRIDGFDYDAYDSSLHTVVRVVTQMQLVDQLIVWLGNYLAGTPHTGEPPAPYSLTPSPSLAERISAFDAVTPDIAR